MISTRRRSDGAAGNYRASEGLWKPALNSMSEEEIFTLNRLVTSNFRNAEKNGQISLAHNQTGGDYAN